MALRGAAPLFYFAGNCAGRFGKDSSTLARHLGGVMDEESGGSKSAIQVKGPGPEKGLGDVVDVLLEIAEKALQDGLVGVVQNVAVQVTEKQHVPSLKLLVDLVERLKAMKKLPRGEHESFAAVLWKEYRVIEGEVISNGE